MNAQKPTVFRRDFLFGSIAGIAATGAAGLMTPLEVRAKALPEGTQLCFGQFGEDLIVNALFERLKVEKPTYLDIGACDPIIGSNTYSMYRKGSRGVLVEPNVDLIATLKTRIGDTVLNVGIGVGTETETDFYVMNHTQLSTFDGDEAKQRQESSGGKTHIVRVVKMPLVNVNRIIDENFAGKSPDFVSVDTEGFDIHILRSFDFAKHRPKLICAETLGSKSLRMEPEITELLQSKGYEVRGMTLANTIYVDKTLLG
jgi:FkbM family methyltransferase